MENMNDLIGYEGLYKINKQGQVWSIKFKRYMKPSLYENYLIFNLTNKDKKRKTCRIHRLLAIQYIPTDNYDLVIDHIDRNRQNNSLDNLRWVSQKENSNNIKECDGTLFLDKSTTERTGKEFWKAGYSITDENGLRVRHQKSSHSKQEVEDWLNEIKATNKVPESKKVLLTEEQLKENKKLSQKKFRSKNESKQKRKERDDKNRDKINKRQQDKRLYLKELTYYNV